MEETRPVLKSLNVEQTHDRTGRLVTDTAAVQDDSQVFHEANTLNVDEEVLRERMEKSMFVHGENHEPMMVNEADMDFKIPGLPHSVVEHAQSTSVRQLIQKIVNHPNRQALQQDLRQNQSFNLFSPESKQMIRDVGNIELCELCKEYTSYYRKLATETIQIQKNYKSTEDKHETNHINNKYNDMNMNTRKMHNI